VHDPQVRKTAQRLKAWPPNMILERGLSDGCDARPQQQLQEAEENRQRPQRQLIAWRWHETGTGMGHAFLDLVPADRWAAKSPCDTMRQRGLPGADRAADNHKSRYRCHPAGIANITQSRDQRPYRLAERPVMPRLVRGG